MAAITHRHDEFHRGLVPEDQLGDLSPTAGDVLTATGGGEAEWLPAAGGGGGSWKAPVRAATLVNGTLATAYENGDTVDGVVLATGDRILLKDQASAPANGIYTVNASGAPTRATDFDTAAEALGAVVLVLEGTQADRVFILTTDAPFTIGSDSLDFSELGMPDIESLLTTETDPTLVLGPDGSGGVEFRAEGGIARIVAPVAIANTETVVTSFSMAAGFMAVGTYFFIKAYGRLTSGATPGSSIFRCRIGTTTLTGNIPATLTIGNATLVTNAPFVLEMLVTVRTAGAGGTVIGNVAVNGGLTVAPFTVVADVSAISATVAVDTTATKLIELTYISGNAGTTTTFENAVVDRR